jgi:hypothetical protein
MFSIQNGNEERRGLGVEWVSGDVIDGSGVERVGWLFHQAKKAVNSTSITNTNQPNQ